ncbi:MAG: cbb3-type cytochrome oxidase assembly protein CcoS [Bdellovibrionota bacterium]
MNIIYFLVPLALLLGTSFVVMFICSVRSGQYDDLDTPARRLLIEDETLDRNEKENREKAAP